MAVLLPGKFIFLCTPHTGSMAVAYALKKIPGAINVQDKAWGVGHHATLAQVKEAAADKMSGNERVFAFVRNPYDVIVTWYLRERGRSREKYLVRMLGHRPSLAEFIQAWVESQPDVYFHEGRIFYHAEDAGHVLRYERGLEREVNWMLRKLGDVPSVKIPVQNETPAKDHWSTYFDADAYRVTNAAFQHEFVKYGYQFLWG